MTLPGQRVHTTADIDKAWDFGETVNGLAMVKAAIFPWTRFGLWKVLVFAVIGIVRVRVRVTL